MAQLTAAAYLRVNDAAWRLLSDGPLGKQGAPQREGSLVKPLPGHTTI